VNAHHTLTLSAVPAALLPPSTTTPSCPTPQRLEGEMLVYLDVAGRLLGEIRA
jgi:hypothetical protein